MVIRVTLIAAGDEALAPAPGRDLLASSSHTFADLADATDRAFGRWDLAHLHEFRLSDDRVIGMSDPDGFEGGEATIDERRMTLGAARLEVGDAFEYVFDLGDEWTHRCVVVRGDVDPTIESGGRPAVITPVFGWGVLPDQYGRTGPDDDE